mgnify:CR=1 FL=1
MGALKEKATLLLLHTVTKAVSITKYLLDQEGTGVDHPNLFESRNIERFEGYGSKVRCTLKGTKPKSRLVRPNVQSTCPPRFSRL